MTLNEKLTLAVALIALGVAAGQDFQMNRWTALFWGVVALWGMFSLVKRYRDGREKRHTVLQLEPPEPTAGLVQSPGSGLSHVEVPPVVEGPHTLPSGRNIVIRDEIQTQIALNLKLKWHQTETGLGLRVINLERDVVKAFRPWITEMLWRSTSGEFVQVREFHSKGPFEALALGEKSVDLFCEEPVNFVFLTADQRQLMIHGRPQNAFVIGTGIGKGGVWQVTFDFSCGDSQRLVGQPKQMTFEWKLGKPPSPWKEHKADASDAPELTGKQTQNSNPRPGPLLIVEAVEAVHASMLVGQGNRPVARAVSYAVLRIKNDPPIAGPSGVARNVTAHAVVRRADGFQLSVECVWPEIPRAPNGVITNYDGGGTEVWFNVGQRRDLKIAFKWTDRDTAYAIRQQPNVDANEVEAPGLAIPVGEFDVTVELRSRTDAIRVDVPLKLVNSGVGSPLRFWRAPVRPDQGQ